ncbi:hypothetical protein FO519_007033 [Halicephalobus sp. NKZ332]|nr:hypothetical protein FO519_007033 [Halicephalobus sp. NKZ332]
MGGSPSKEIKSSQGSFRNSSPNEFHPYQDFFSFIKTICPVDVRKIKAADELVKISLELEKFIKTDEKLVKGLSQEARELLKIKSEPIFYATRSLTMATEHYRLKTNLSKSDPEEVRKSVDELLPIVRYSDIYNRLSRFMDQLSVFQQD